MNQVDPATAVCRYCGLLLRERPPGLAPDIPLDVRLADDPGKHTHTYCEFRYGQWQPIGTAPEGRRVLVAAGPLVSVATLWNGRWLVEYYHQSYRLPVAPQPSVAWERWQYLPPTF